MKTLNFSINPKGHCPVSKTVPDQKSIRLVWSSSKKKLLKNSKLITTNEYE